MNSGTCYGKENSLENLSYIYKLIFIVIYGKFPLEIVMKMSYIHKLILIVTYYLFMQNIRKRSDGVTRDM